MSIIPSWLSYWTELQTQEAGTLPEDTGSASSEWEEKQGIEEFQELEDDSEDIDIIKEFLLESSENLDEIDQDLVALEKNPKDKNLLSSIFRALHTIKGTCGFVGFSKLESIAHVSESLLSKLRDDELQYNSDIASSLMSMVDSVRQILSCIENEGNEGDVNYSQLVERLTDLQNQDESTYFAPAAQENFRY